MEAEVVNIRGLTFLAKADSSHWVTMDNTPELNGSNAGAKPMELLLMAVGGCTGMDVVSIIQKMKVKYDRFELKLKAERSKEDPKVLTTVHIEYVFHGKEVDEAKVRKAIDLSMERYCSVSAMVRKTAKITTGLTIVRD